MRRVAPAWSPVARRSVVSSTIAARKMTMVAAVPRFRPPAAWGSASQSRRLRPACPGSIRDGGRVQPEGADGRVALLPQHAGADEAECAVGRPRPSGLRAVG
jgi:hypothetical protein